MAEDVDFKKAAQMLPWERTGTGRAALRYNKILELPREQSDLVSGLAKIESIGIGKSSLGSVLLVRDQQLLDAINKETGLDCNLGK